MPANDHLFFPVSCVCLCQRAQIKRPHIIYRYQADLNQQLAGGELAELAANPHQPGASWRQCGASRLHEWALRQYNKMEPPPPPPLGPLLDRVAKRRSPETQATPVDGESGSPPEADCEQRTGSVGQSCDKLNATDKGRQLLLSKRDVSLTEKYIELALILSKDMFDKRNSSSRNEVLHDAIQVINCLDLYFRSANTRVALIYVETWANGDQIDITTDAKETLYNFLEYSTRKLYKVSMDAVHLLTGGYGRQFDNNEVGMSIPDSICSSRAVSVSQEANIFEPFIAASTIAHMLGHNLGMEHDQSQPVSYQQTADGLNQIKPAGSGETLAHNPPGQVRVASSYPARPTHSSPAPANGLDQEEQDDEIKSRSVKSAGSEQAQLGHHADESSDKYPLLADECRSNCLMSERFSYFQPPVSIGNMIQKQVAAGNYSGTPMVTMYNLSQDPQADNQPSSVQIDNELEQQQQQLQTGNQLSVTERQQPIGATRLPYSFSRKSLDTYHRLLRLGHGICLFNKPNQLEDFKTCGNGIVDKGEDCDCGTFKECLESDSCCDPITCRFKADAECINGSCCDRCRLRPKGFVCRKSRGECDLAELCDGKSGQCGPDVHKHNGHTCQTGYCYLGLCPSHDQQCAELWGSDARRSDRLCYATFNPNGTIRGNCGYEGNSPRSLKYKRCDQEHLMCGTLQCQLGDMKPATAQLDAGAGQQHQAEFSKKILHTNDGQHHECKVITGWPLHHSSADSSGPQSQSSNGLQSASNNGLTHSSISYVRDGSKCANNKVCFNQTCQPLDLVYRDAFELCPRDEKGHHCSGNGVCSTANRCHCEPAWTGHDCSQRISPAATATATLLEQPTQQASSLVAQPVQSQSHHMGVQSNPLFANPAEETLLVANGSAARGGRLKPLNAPLSQGLGTYPSIESDLATATSATNQRADQLATSEPPSTSLAPQPVPQAQSTPAPQTSSSSAVPDKKKHDAFGAPTLVLILVAVVAAVFIGFATMANCYRRKGFLRPDKVLRHHQMNCKMDALRSSFIAKRLADADLGRDLGAGAHRTSLVPGRMSALQPHDLINPFVAPPLAPAAGSAAYQHQAAIYSSNGGMPANEDMVLPMGYSYDAEEPTTMVKRHPFNQPAAMMKPRVSMSINLNKQQYFDDSQPNDMQQVCIHQQQSDRLEPTNFQYNTQEIGDRVPLLMSASERQGGRPRTLNQLGMRSFQARRDPMAPPHWSHTNTLSTQRASRRQHTIPAAMGVVDPPPINRATSLGNVHNRQQRHLTRPREDDDDDYDCEDEGRHALSARQALATPLRAVASRHNGQIRLGCSSSRRSNFVDDSCSAPSSPDHRNPYWSASSTRLGDASHQVSCHEDAIMSSTMSSQARHNHHHQHHRGHRHNQQRQSLTNVHSSSSGGTKRALDQAMRQLSFERRNFGSKRTQMDDCDLDDEIDFMPPPPPPILDDALVSGSEERNGDMDDVGDDTEPSLDAQPDSQHLGGRTSKLKSSMPTEAALAARSPVSSMRTVKRVPLNSSASEHQQQSDGFGQLSLIAQLQQLERVQSLHTKQVASLDTKTSFNSSSASGADGLHEFFSLPLSVQLSALLARSISQDPPPVSFSTPIDDYLNTLNNSNVATSSRRSFKRSNQQAGYSGGNSGNQDQQQVLQQTGTWSGPQVQSKRQQMKLANLQGLIVRLQKLHNQTMEELNSRDLDDQETPPTTTGRARSRGPTRINQTTDDLFVVSASQQITKADEGRNWARSGQRRPLRSRQNSGGSKNESVYSMSDSEDGVIVSRMLNSYKQPQRPAAAKQSVQNEAGQMPIKQSSSKQADMARSVEDPEQQPQTLITQPGSSISPPSSNNGGAQSSSWSGQQNEQVDRTNESSTRQEPGGDGSTRDSPHLDD